MYFLKYYDEPPFWFFWLKKISLPKIGQFMSRGGVQVWNITPMLKGIGYACLVMIVWINVYYIIILAWTAFYFFQAIS